MSFKCNLPPNIYSRREYKQKTDQNQRCDFSHKDKRLYFYKILFIKTN